jgi:hypothetical protein
MPYFNISDNVSVHSCNVSFLHPEVKRTRAKKGGCLEKTRRGVHDLLGGAKLNRNVSTRLNKYVIQSLTLF